MKKNFKKLLKNCDLFKGKMNGFTLAEVLITLGIIGIVAAVTIPTLMKNYQNYVWKISSQIFERKFGEALKIMNNQGTLANHQTTESFVKELSKVFKVAKICDNTQLDQCFESSIVWGNSGNADLSNVTKAKDISIYNWDTNIVGVRFINNVSALIAYNPNCKQNQNDSNLIQIGGGKDNSGFSTNNCFAMLYDINADSKPNTLNKDVRITSNVRDIKPGIITTINNIKITKVVLAGKYDYADCSNENGEDYEFCYNDKTYPKSYWAAAAKICEGRENMITINELYELAKYLYDDDTIPIDRTDGTLVSGTQNPEKIKEFMDIGFTNEFSVWSQTSTFARKFKKNSTGVVSNVNYTKHSVICVKH